MKKETSINKKQRAKIRIGLDLGNKHTNIYLNNHTYKFRTSILFDEENITIGDKHPKSYLLYLFNLIDLVTGLKDQRNQQKVQAIKKYYPYQVNYCENQVYLNLKVLEEFQFKRKLKVNLNTALYEYLWNIIQNSIKKELPNFTYQQFQVDIAVNFYGFQTNIYKFILENILISMPFKVRPFFRKSTAALASYYYLNQCQNLKLSKKLAILQFGDRGLAFSIYKMNPHSQKIIQCLQNYENQYGGLNITRVIMDLIVQNVKIQNGIDILNHPEIASKVPEIAQQAKIALSQSDTVFIRVAGYPLQSVCGFYLAKHKVQKKIQQKIKFMLQKIKVILKKYQNQKLDFILSGKSILVPLFKAQLKNIYQKQIIKAQENWMVEGLFLTLTQQLTILQILSEPIKLVGDQGFEQIIAQNKADLPLRFLTQMSFPSSELTFTLKILQYNTIIGTYVVQSSNLRFDQKFDCIIQVQQNKPIKMYSSRKYGEITMKGNFKITRLNKSNLKAKIICDSDEKQYV